ncbi:hypothetical protein [Microbacterium invictum]|uniref:Uncharacterized protein n=1 Tax=Microbacterium invictum TaxID=515415 RepID=A0AA40SPC7_9MICO|nr:MULTISPECIES: hypothetical protein [Microbacterium]MBB4139881.1 hypothetical protein [Microbacterium invictum]
MRDAASPTLPDGPVTAWVWGGGLLIASALLQLVMMTGMDAIAGSRQVGYWLGVALLAAALVVFALGLHGRGSVVARRTPGMIALFALAGWPFLNGVVTLFLPSGQTAADLEAYGIWATVAAVLWLGAALTSVMAIGRAGVVPGRWRWAPAWALAVIAGSYALVQVVGVAVASMGPEPVLVFFQLQSMLTVLVPVLLGILAIVLGLTPRPAGAVQVYPSAPEPTAGTGDTAA